MHDDAPDEMRMQKMALSFGVRRFIAAFVSLLFSSFGASYHPKAGDASGDEQGPRLLS
jgi:hypothetical protein